MRRLSQIAAAVLCVVHMLAGIAYMNFESTKRSMNGKYRRKRQKENAA